MKLKNLKKRTYITDIYCADNDLYDKIENFFKTFDIPLNAKFELIEDKEAGYDDGILWHHIVQIIVY